MAPRFGIAARRSPVGPFVPFSGRRAFAWRLACAAGMVTALTGLVSCSKITKIPAAVVGQSGPPPVNDGAPLPQRGAPATTIEDIARAQSAAMDFTDDFTVSMAEAIDGMEGTLTTPEARLAAHKLKYTVAHGATIIAASANPRVALLDMMVMISLQRAMIDRVLAPQVFGGQAEPLQIVFRDGEARIRALAATCFSDAQLAELDKLIAQWLEANPDRRYTGYVRFEQFAAARMMSIQQQPTATQSLFGLMFVDPLAGLDPATRELEQTRRVAERAMFYMQRMPQLVSWQAELLYMDTATEPEMQGLVRDVERVTASVESVTQSVGELQSAFPEIVAKEREAAINQAFDRLGAERTAMLDELAARGKEIDATLARVQETLQAGERFSSETSKLVESVDKLRAAFEGPPKDPNAPPEAPSPSLDEYRATIAEAQSLTTQLKELITATESVAKSDAWELRRKDLNAAADDVENRTRAVISDVDARAQAITTRFDETGREMIELAYRRGLVLVSVLVGGIFVSVVASRVIPRRVRTA